MEETPADHVVVELTNDEARLVIAALRQFEPYWPSDMDDLGRAGLLDGVRTAIGRVSALLDAPARPEHPQPPR